jgi:hypothetical protein
MCIYLIYLLYNCVIWFFIAGFFCKKKSQNIFNSETFLLKSEKQNSTNYSVEFS